MTTPASTIALSTLLLGFVSQRLSAGSRYVDMTTPNTHFASGPLGMLLSYFSYIQHNFNSDISFLTGHTEQEAFSQPSLPSAIRRSLRAGRGTGGAVSHLERIERVQLAPSRAPPRRFVSPVNSEASVPRNPLAALPPSKRIRSANRQTGV